MMIKLKGNFSRSNKLFYLMGNINSNIESITRIS